MSDSEGSTKGKRGSKGKAGRGAASKAAGKGRKKAQKVLSIFPTSLCILLDL